MSSQVAFGLEHLEGTRVLIVDDDPAVCRTTATGLACAGYIVVTALDGDRAIEQAVATRPDVAVVDMNMPHSVAVIRALKKNYGVSVCVIAFTDMDDDDARRASLDAGCDDFVVKPICMAELRMRIAIGARKQRAAMEARIAREIREREHAHAREAIALLAHDLNNAITGCLNTLSLVGENCNLEGELSDFVRGSAASLRLMAVLVTNLVDVTRFEDAAVRPHVRLIKVRAFLESILSVHAALSTKNRAWELDCDPTLTARFDPSLVERILHNIIGNARRYAGKHGRVRVKAGRWLEVLQGSIEVSVENSGPPVSPEMAAKLFSKYGVGTDGKRGLGLYFCKLACEAHGGTIDYQTIDGRPVFVIRLPGSRVQPNARETTRRLARIMRDR